MQITTNDKTLIFDESGNMGKNGRYFIISCIETNHPKEIHNIMKKKLLQAKCKFPNAPFSGCELKASNAYPCIKYHILECLCNKSIDISYITIDLLHTSSSLLRDNNLLYNYACKLLINNLIDNSISGKNLNIWFDNHTVKVHSKNSFSDYIKLELIYNRNINASIAVEYINSNANDAYVIQAADYVANAIYTKYEYGNSLYYDILTNKIKNKEHFPANNFGI